MDELRAKYQQIYEDMAEAVLTARYPEWTILIELNSMMYLDLLEGDDALPDGIRDTITRIERATRDTTVPYPQLDGFIERMKALLQ